MPKGRTRPKKTPPLVSSSKVYQQLVRRSRTPRNTSLKIADASPSESESNQTHIHVLGVELTTPSVSFASSILHHAKGDSNFADDLRKHVHRAFRDKPNMCETKFRDTLCAAFEKQHIINTTMSGGLQALETY